MAFQTPPAAHKIFLSRPQTAIETQQVQLGSRSLACLSRSPRYFKRFSTRRSPFSGHSLAGAAHTSKGSVMRAFTRAATMQLCHSLASLRLTRKGKINRGKSESKISHATVIDCHVGEARGERPGEEIARKFAFLTRTLKGFFPSDNARRCLCSVIVISRIAFFRALCRLNFHSPRIAKIFQ